MRLVDQQSTHTTRKTGQVTTRERERDNSMQILLHTEQYKIFCNKC